MLLHSVGSNGLLRHRQCFGNRAGSKQCVLFRTHCVTGRNGFTAAGRNLVVAVDADEVSWDAVKFTVEEICKDGDVLHLLHVIPKDALSAPVPPAFLASMPMASMDSMEFEESLEHHARQFLQEALLPLSQSKRAKCEIDLIVGTRAESIGHIICKKSEELNAAIVVVPARNAGLIEELGSRLFSGGSYSYHVIKHCKQPTLLFQPRQQHKAAAAPA